MTNRQKRSISWSEGCGEKQLPTSKCRRLNTQPASGEYSRGSHSRHLPNRSSEDAKLAIAQCGLMKEDNVITVKTVLARRRRRPGSSAYTDTILVEYTSEFTIVDGCENNEEPVWKEVKVDYDEVMMSPTGDNGGGDGGIPHPEETPYNQENDGGPFEVEEPLNNQENGGGPFEADEPLNNQEIGGGPLEAEEPLNNQENDGGPFEADEPLNNQENGGDQDLDGRTSGPDNYTNSSPENNGCQDGQAEKEDSIIYEEVVIEGNIKLTVKKIIEKKNSK